MIKMIKFGFWKLFVHTLLINNIILKIKYNENKPCK